MKALVWCGLLIVGVLSWGLVLSAGYFLAQGVIALYSAPLALRFVVLVIVLSLAGLAWIDQCCEVITQARDRRTEHEQRRDAWTPSSGDNIRPPRQRFR